MFDVLLQTPTQVAEYSHRNVLCNRKDGHKATQDVDEEGEGEENLKLKCVNVHMLIIIMKCL